MYKPEIHGRLGDYVKELEEHLDNACKLVFGDEDHFGMDEMVDNYYEVHTSSRFLKLREYSDKK